ncbi:hypothetical protein EV421DRAFT_1075834 [Armillaria borealis]|uniref:Nephrocystin 3-like N-terminal domain-containing protein n=1 Tax=Armillaria borealis TaxID=47425 RepID=A0AA39MKM0_9AGAR|nr:hypothetical protein EV421DRAFT_1075834 [Armillaria borealis]
MLSGNITRISPVRPVRMIQTTEIFDTAKRIRDGFQSWKNTFQMNLTKVLLDMAQEAKEQQEISKNIRKLEKASDLSNKLGPKSTCMRGTRVQAINQIENWIDRRDGGTFWCRGMAGTGKSSLMATLHKRLTIQACDRLENESEAGEDDRTSVSARGASLAAFIRYDRNTKPSADKLIPTIAHSLCGLNPSIYPDIRTAISRVVRDNQSVLDMSSSAREQFRLLLQRPLIDIRGLLEDKPSLVIIVDGLDECQVSNEMLAVLAEGFGPDLPFMRLIVSSRPHPDITSAFKAVPPSAQLYFDPLSKDANQDVQTYIRSRFQDIYKKAPALKSRCEALHAVENFTLQAKGFFIWAVIVCNVIERFPYESSLQRVLDTPSNVAVGSMIYKTVLDSIIADKNDNMELKEHILELKQYIRDALVVIVANVATGEPISVPTFKKVVARRRGGLEPFSVLEMLGSVLQVSDKGVIQPVHGTFFDFLQDKEKCGDDWYIDVEQEGPAVHFRLDAVEMGLDLDSPIVQNAYHALFPAA